MNDVTLFNKFEANKREVKIACDFLPDCSTREGYEKSKRIALDARRVEKAIDDVRLYMRKEAMEEANFIHREGNKLCAEINSYYIAHQEAYKKVDEEKKRIEKEAYDKITDQIQEFGDSVIQAHLMSIEDINAVIKRFDNNRLIFGDRTKVGSQERDRAIEELEKIIVLKLDQERIAKEMEAEAEKLKIEREEIARLREIQIIESAKEEAKREERQRALEEERIAKEIDLKRAEDVKHKKLIESGAIECFFALGFSSEDSERIVHLISGKNIVNVSINY